MRAIMRWGRGILALLLPLAGAAMLAASLRHFYATALLAVLGGVWLVLLVAWPDPPLAPPPPPPDPQADPVASRRLNLMLDHAPVPLALRTREGAWQAANRAARRLFETDDRIIADAPRLEAAVASHQGGPRAPVPLGTPPRPYAVTATRFSTAETLVALVDIQAEIQAAEARALRELLHILGHEIMNSLTPIISLSESAAALLASDPADGAAEAREALAVVARRAAGLDRFVRAYRALAQLPSPVRRQSSVTVIMRDAARLFEIGQRADPVALRLDLPVPDIVAALDPDLVGQALLALLANAADAARANPDRPAEVRLAAGAGAGAVWISVADSGAGVAPERASLIFDLMVSFKQGGSGIGLTLARQIARGHGGDVTLAAADGGSGAFFRLEVR